jgi:hypothetical protein
MNIDNYLTLLLKTPHSELITPHSKTLTVSILKKIQILLSGRLSDIPQSCGKLIEGMIFGNDAENDCVKTFSYSLARAKHLT